MSTTTSLTLARTIASQIGNMNIAAISGGRVVALFDESQSEVIGIRLPVAHGYSVEVVLDRASDTYTVRRVFLRGDKRWVKGERTFVYCDEVGEVAYRASCYHHDF